MTIRFRNPEYELADSGFPLVLITHTGISRDTDREARGYTTIGYAPEGLAPWPDINDPTRSPYSAQMPVPLAIDYQIEAFTRKQAHMTELIGQLLQFDRLPPRFGYLQVPQDGTVRRLDILGGPESTETKDQLGKRLFVAAWSIRVSAELFLSEIDHLTQVQTIALDLVDAPAYAAGHQVPLDPTVRLSPVAVAPSASNAPPPALIGTPYQYALTATGGVPPYHWVLESGALPPGLALTEDGQLFGTPTAPTVSPISLVFGLTDSDSPSQVARQTLSIAVSGS
ncbi:Ig domain-containing protein [Saccharothrix sp. ST-888]|uniref:Ig domain-containing protein n=1 Tax=Saccharothrix sp. ST-888 TaxID=1427391 RepID=UPI0005ECAEEE|nr:Ig domain-containing protein [Saccharothrix sp. ST-888]KJK55360.1 hypothetical protein UK12_29250 [Saccharothrix sp. ST-888]